MLVQRQDLAHGVGGQLQRHDGLAGPVAAEAAVGDEEVWHVLGAQLLGRLACGSPEQEEGSAAAASKPAGGRSRCHASQPSYLFDDICLLPSVVKWLPHMRCAALVMIGVSTTASRDCR